MSELDGRYAGESPIACGLTGMEQDRRREELSRELFSGRTEAKELEDGYEFVFPGERGWAERLVSFVVLERECCPFFTFEMIFRSEKGRISLRIRGPAGTRALIADGLYGGRR